jgi:hypothetical protein
MLCVIKDNILMEEFDCDLDPMQGFDVDELNSSSKDSLDLQLKDGEILNPLFVSVGGSAVCKLSSKEIFLTYKTVYALCRKHGHEKDDLSDLLKSSISEDRLNELKDSVILVKGPMKLIKNKNHRKEAIQLNHHYLEKFNHKKYNFSQQDEIVILMLDMVERNMETYFSIYDSSNSIEQLQKLMVLYECYNCYAYPPTRNVISQFVTSLKDTEYWQQPYNCAMTITNAFIKRKFQDFIIKKDVIASVMATGTADSSVHKFMKSIADTETKYVDDLSHVEKKERFVDASNACNSQNQQYRLYHIDHTPIELTKGQIYEMFKLCHDEKARYDLFNSLLISKTHCHLVLTNGPVLEFMRPTIMKFLSLYRYLMGYSWVCFMMEEGIQKTWTKKTDRFVFDINTASKLPFFPFLHSQPHHNPYLPIMVNRNDLSCDENFFGLAMIQDFEEYGINTLEEFRTKFNMFTTARPDICILDGLECEDGTSRWKNFAVSGSVMTATVPKKTTLYNNVKFPPGQNDKDTWGRVFNEYYDASDIDVMCITSSVFEFMRLVNEQVIPVIKKNLSRIHGINVDDSIKVTPIKNLMIKISQEFIPILIKDMEGVNYDFVLKNITSPEVNEKFYLQYITAKTAKNSAQRRLYKNNPLYLDFFAPNDQKDMDVQIIGSRHTRATTNQIDSEIYIFMSDIDKTKKYKPEDDILLCRIRETIRFKISAQPFLEHPIEVFKVYGDDYFSTVSRFHLGCVRSYYDGADVYLLPSCISALMTNMNPDYKYFAGIRNPCDILIKNQGRGFGTYLNKSEREAIYSYVTTEGNKWSDRLKIDKRNAGHKRDFLSPRKLDNLLYYPNADSKSTAEEMYACTSDIRYVLTMDDLRTQFKIMSDQKKSSNDKKGIDIFNYTTIGEDGCVTPLKRWVIDAVWDQQMN